MHVFFKSSIFFLHVSNKERALASPSVIYDQTADWSEQNDAIFERRVLTEGGNMCFGTPFNHLIQTIWHSCYHCYRTTRRPWAPTLGKNIAGFLFLCEIGKFSLCMSGFSLNTLFTSLLRLVATTLNSTLTWGCVHKCVCVFLCDGLVICLVYRFTSHQLTTGDRHQPAQPKIITYIATQRN